MEPAAATSWSTPAWRGMVRRLTQAWEERAQLGQGRVEELEAEVVRLRAEKKAAERAAAALRAELEAEQSAAETAAAEAMVMIVRLQREKSAAVIEARELRRVAECRAAHVRELQDQLAEASELAASYQERLRAHGGIDRPDEVKESESGRHEQHRAAERVDAEGKGVLIGEEPSSLPSPSSPPPAAELFEDKYAVDVRCAAAVTTTKTLEKDRIAAADVVRDLRARVETLEADGAAVRREVAALLAAEKQGFSVLAVFKWFFSPVLWGLKRTTSAARMFPNVVCSSAGSFPTYFLLGLLPLLGRSKGTLQIQSKTSRQPVHLHGSEYLMLCYFFQ